MTKEKAHKILCRKIMPCLIGEWREAISIAAKALEAEPHWIPVTERLPERSGDYLVTRDIIEVYEPEACVIDYFEADTLNWDGYGNLVIAWMPLPKVFKENEHESN